MTDLCQEVLSNIYSKYGYDFRDYSPEMITRRMQYSMDRENVADLSEFNELLMSKKDVFARLVNDFSINVSAMFRDPEVWRHLRENVIPGLKSYPIIRIWSAGTASGQEAYSLAILLKEAGLYDRSIIYATDLNPISLDKAAQGRYSLEKMAQYTANYYRSGGSEDFSKYFTTNPHSAQLDPELQKNIVFCTHSLEADGVFNQFQLILCRNVLIYFNNRLVDRVFRLFSDSLVTRGNLCLGARESMFPYESKRFFTQDNFDQQVFKRAF